MSQRTYAKDQLRVVIEGVGKVTGAEGDLWYVTATLEADVEITGTLWTAQVRELVEKLERCGWSKTEVRKESHEQDEKTTLTQV